MIYLQGNTHRKGLLIPISSDFDKFGGDRMFAVIKTGGKQYKVEKGSVIKVEKLAADVDSDVEIKEVLMVGEGNDIKVGSPFVTTASVVATVKEHGKGEKKINFKYDKKTYYRKKGHRQLFTTIEIKSING